MPKTLFLCVCAHVLRQNNQDTDLATGNAMVEVVKSFASAEGSSVVVVSAQVESELAGLEQEDRADFLAELGVTDPTKVMKSYFFRWHMVLMLR